jgi:hypothetical protein
LKANEPFKEKYLLPMEDVSKIIAPVPSSIPADTEPPSENTEVETGWKYTTLENKGHAVTLT